MLQDLITSEFALFRMRITLHSYAFVNVIGMNNVRYLTAFFFQAITFDIIFVSLNADKTVTVF